MRELLRLCIITVVSMLAIASALHLGVALDQNASASEALISLGISSGAFGLWGLLDTGAEIERLQAP